VRSRCDIDYDPVKKKGEKEFLKRKTSFLGRHDMRYSGAFVWLLTNSCHCYGSFTAIRGRTTRLIGDSSGSLHEASSSVHLQDLLSTPFPFFGSSMLAVGRVDVCG